jgi:hypothetical protein
MSGSIGSDEWYCPIHFGQSFGVMQAITGEINRHPEMVRAINGIRDGGVLSRRAWAESARKIITDLHTSGQGALTPLTGERAKAWMQRIEGALLAHCWPLMHPPEPVQASLVPDGLERVQFDVPEF